MQRVALPLCRAWMICRAEEPTAVRAFVDVPHSRSSWLLVCVRENGASEKRPFTPPEILNFLSPGILRRMVLVPAATTFCPSSPYSIFIRILAIYGYSILSLSINQIDMIYRVDSSRTIRTSLCVGRPVPMFQLFLFVESQ